MESSDDARGATSVPCWAPSASSPRRSPPRRSSRGRCTGSGCCFTTTTRPIPARIAFREGLRELGCVEGQNYVLELRFAEGQADRFPASPPSWSGSRWTSSSPPAHRRPRRPRRRPRRSPSSWRPTAIPVERGAVASLARPGGNVTGLRSMSLDLDSKRLELLKGTVPPAVRVAYLLTAPVTNRDPWLVQRGRRGGPHAGSSAAARLGHVLPATSTPPSRP